MISTRSLAERGWAATIGYSVSLRHSLLTPVPLTPKFKAHRRGPATRKSIALGILQRAGSRPVQRELGVELGTALTVQPSMMRVRLEATSAPASAAHALNICER